MINNLAEDAEFRRARFDGTGTIVMPAFGSRPGSDLPRCDLAPVARNTSIWASRKARSLTFGKILLRSRGEPIFDRRAFRTAPPRRPHRRACGARSQQQARNRSLAAIDEQGGAEEPSRRPPWPGYRTRRRWRSRRRRHDIGPNRARSRSLVDRYRPIRVGCAGGASRTLARGRVRSARARRWRLSSQRPLRTVTR